MIRPPPRSPLFPYTPLSRSQTMEPPQFIPSREVARHGGRPAYRAHDADSQAWESALRTRGSLPEDPAQCVDRKSTRLNSSHGYISYAVFCLKKKKKQTQLRD